MDVHPPHEPIHSWRDFFIHIATIVVGLLIAVGLEQTVEYLHQRHHVREARERIHAEVEVNDRICEKDLVKLKLYTVQLRHNLDVLGSADSSQHEEHLGATLDGQGLYNAAMNSARESGALSMMPYEESAMYSDAYLEEAATNEAFYDTFKVTEALKAVARDRPLRSMSAAERQSLSTLTATALGQAEYLILNLSISREEWHAITSGTFRNDIDGAIR